MLDNIFYLTWDESGESCIVYPEDIVQLQNPRVLRQIIQTNISGGSISKINYSALSIDGFNLYCSLISERCIIGLILDDKDNPYDYEIIFSNLLQECIVPQWRDLAQADEFTITTALLSLYIDIRRYSDEILQPRNPEVQSKILKLFICGLDNAGKSTFVHYLKTGEFIPEMSPTRRFNIEHIQLEEGLEIIAWDMPGQQLFRASWLKGVQDSNIFIFMVDLAEPDRFDEAKLELWKMLNRYELKGVPLLVLGNKLDRVNGAIHKKSLVEDFELDYVKNRSWHLVLTSIKNAYGIDESIQWISRELQAENLVV